MVYSILHNCIRFSWSILRCIDMFIFFKPLMSHYYMVHLNQINHIGSSFYRQYVLHIYAHLCNFVQIFFLLRIQLDLECRTISRHNGCIISVWLYLLKIKSIISFKVCNTKKVYTIQSVTFDAVACAEEN